MPSPALNMLTCLNASFKQVSGRLAVGLCRSRTASHRLAACPILSRPVPCRAVPSRPIPSRPVPSCPVLSCPVPSRPVLLRAVLSCPVPSCPILSHPMAQRAWAGLAWPGLAWPGLMWQLLTNSACLSSSAGPKAGRGPAARCRRGYARLTRLGQPHRCAHRDIFSRRDCIRGRGHCSLYDPRCRRTNETDRGAQKKCAPTCGAC